MTSDQINHTFDYEEEEPTWITRDGDEIPVMALETDHLANIIGMLERNAQPHLARIGLTGVERIYPIYTALVAEMDRRLKLPVPVAVNPETPIQLERASIPKTPEKPKPDPDDDGAVRFSLLDLD